MENNDCKITIVYNKRTRKLLPFLIDDLTGEIIITATGAYNQEDIIVSRVNPLRLDLLNGYLLPEGETYAED